MPDFKFNGKFYFSLLSGSGHALPLFIPRIHNPDFIDLNTFKIKSPPGIVQLLKGDLGITEQIMGKVLEPVLKSLSQNKLIAEQFASMSFPDVTYPDVVSRARMSDEEVANLARKNFIRKVVPKDAGLKAMEKSLITGMMESHKPLLELAKLLVEMLAIAEDIVCMLFGTSIRIFGRNIGFPSRNPLYWNDSLGYSMTLNYALYNKEERQITSPFAALQKVTQEFENQMGKNHPLSEIVGTEDEIQESVEQELPNQPFYVGYFTAGGIPIAPSQAIINTGKWFKKEYTALDGTKQTIQSPFVQLSSQITSGTDQLYALHEKMLDTINETALASIRSANSADKGILTEMESEIGKLYDFTKVMLVDGDVDDETQESQPPLILEEWVGKAGAAQLRRRYFPEPTTTAKIDGEGENTTVKFSKFNVELRGKKHLVDVPLAYPHQLDFLGNVRTISVTDGSDKPYVSEKNTHFAHEVFNTYVPDTVKQYFLPMQWEEISEYNVVSRTTGNVIRTETEVIPYTIDVESDYTLRLIKVYNHSENGQEFSVTESKNDLIEAIAYQKSESGYGNNDFFWLVEALPKNPEGLGNDGNIIQTNDSLLSGGTSAANGSASTGGASFSNGSSNGKEWYGLLDKFKIIPKIICKLFPLIFKKTIPLIIKIISLIKNPSKIGDLLLEIALTNENISKVPEHFGFMKEGLTDYASRAARFKTPESWIKQQYMTVPTSKYFYAGYQAPALGNKSNRPQFTLDGTALAEFGKGAFGKSIFNFGARMDVTNGELVKFINKKSKRQDFTAPAVEKEQPIFNMVLNFVKLPFEVIFMIVMWIINWVKRLINPKKILQAVIDFLSFRWLFDIMSKKSMLTILGVPDPETMSTQLETLFDEIASQATKISTPDGMQNLIGFMMESFSEVFVYNVYKNKKYVRTETEEHSMSTRNSQDKKADVDEMFGGLRKKMEEFLANQTGSTDTSNQDDTYTKTTTSIPPEYGGHRQAKQCGVRQFKINDLFPIPFWADMPAYNLCDLPLVVLKPLEMVYSFLLLLQEILNGVLCMPISILGLEPTFHLPRLGKEIPFADIFLRLIEKIRAKIMNI